MRPPKACLNCRTSKRRCDRADTSAACSQCVQRNLQCPTGITSPQLPRSSAPQDSPRCIQSFHQQEENVYLVDLYFRFIHDSPHSLFHEPTFKASVAEGTVSKPVLLAMLGLSARYVIFLSVCMKEPLSSSDESPGLLRSRTLLLVGQCIALKLLQH
jgi:hypothetical protein